MQGAIIDFFAGQSKQRIIFTRIDKAYYTLHSLALEISVKKGVQEEKKIKGTIRQKY
jgi:hypothetical protein